MCPVAFSLKNLSRMNGRKFIISDASAPSFHIAHESRGPAGGPRCVFSHGQSGSTVPSSAMPHDQKPPQRGAYFHGSSSNVARLASVANQKV